MHYTLRNVCYKKHQYTSLNAFHPVKVRTGASHHVLLQSKSEGRTGAIPPSLVPGLFRSTSLEYLLVN
jgi:hypothetical protein